MGEEDATVYVNDTPFGETAVYHARRGHVTQRNRWRGDYVRETTAGEARSDGLRPCKMCYPEQAGASCPGCGHAGEGDEVLAPGQQYCPRRECRVVSFHTGEGDE